LKECHYASVFDSPREKGGRIQTLYPGMTTTTYPTKFRSAELPQLENGKNINNNTTTSTSPLCSAPFLVTNLSLQPPLTSQYIPTNNNFCYEENLGCVLTLSYDTKTYCEHHHNPLPAACSSFSIWNLQIANHASFYHHLDRWIPYASPSLFDLMQEFLQNPSDGEDSEITKLTMQRYAEITQTLGPQSLKRVAGWEEIKYMTKHANILKRYTKLHRILKPVAIQIEHVDSLPQRAIRIVRGPYSMVDLWMQALQNNVEFDHEHDKVLLIQKLLHFAIEIGNHPMIADSSRYEQQQQHQQHNNPSTTYCQVELHRILHSILRILRLYGGSIEMEIPSLIPSINHENNNHKTKKSKRICEIEKWDVWNPYRTALEKIIHKTSEKDVVEKLHNIHEEFFRNFDLISSLSPSPSSKKHSPESPPAPRLYDEHILITEKEDGITEQQFQKQASIMMRVNEYIPRVHDPILSRPRFAKVFIDPEDFAALYDVFFEHDSGRLKKSIIHDISNASKHYYISFTNEMSAGATDRRWQIPLKLHNETSSVTDPSSPSITNDHGGHHYTINVTRQKVQDILESAGIVDSSCERIHDLGLLVGGTEDQSLHHDISRQWTFWMQSVAPGTADGTDSSNHKYKQQQQQQQQQQESPEQMKQVLGWEFNRIGYNDAMADTHAPASFLLSMHRDVHKRHVKVGVQKDQVQIVNEPENGYHRMCRVLHGREFESFPILRENAHLVVVSVETGCVFTGDFPHAGVRNVDPDSMEEQRLDDLNHRITGILLESSINSVDHASTTQRITEMFCDYDGFDSLCRLHFSTELITAEKEEEAAVRYSSSLYSPSRHGNQRRRRGTIMIPRNTIGYTECHCNPADGGGNKVDRVAEPPELPLPEHPFATSSSDAGDTDSESDWKL
jgi:hypothetical protein